MKAWYQLAMHARVKFTIIIMLDVMTLVPYGKNKPATEPTLKLEYAIGIKLTTLSCEKVVTLPLNLGKNPVTSLDCSYCSVLCMHYS